MDKKSFLLGTVFQTIVIFAGLALYLELGSKLKAVENAQMLTGEDSFEVIRKGKIAGSWIHNGNTKYLATLVVVDDRQFNCLSRLVDKDMTKAGTIDWYCSEW